ncbi:hypothetical protein D499_0AD00420 [Hanseniaspora uvarum DSM 2768]|nr:hypothetical protein D499_0AD00420 [Hanseniaspora uvarum DSM 2768]
MIRLSEAHAKMRLSDTVEVSDVKEACRLMQSAIKAYATDPKTGKIDMGLVQTGHSVDEQAIREEFQTWLINYLQVNNYVLDSTISVSDLIKKFRELVEESKQDDEINEDEGSTNLSQLGSLTNTDIGVIIDRMTGDGDLITKNVRSVKHISVSR